ncbi:MAG: alanine racemase [Vibrio sp.]
MITAQAIVDLSALQHNYNNLKAQCQEQKLVAVIKGDAYGHNAVEVAQALSQADMFAVARIEEAITLREAGITQPIQLLEGCFCQDDLKVAAELNLDTTIHSPESLRDLQQAELAQPIRVWLKIDTGMHRIGVRPEEVDTYVQALQASGKVAGDVGFMSHFYLADDVNSSATHQQIAIFKQATHMHPGPKNLANSAGILFWHDCDFDYCRGGIALYGISPDENQWGQELGLQPVMTLQSKLIAVRPHLAHESIGYGQTWTAECETRIGVVALGYGDGYPRCAPIGTPVMVNGRRVPIVGRVSMDMITVDLGAESQDCVGDCVEFWGNQLPIEEVAKAIGTIPYELVIKVAPRVDKHFLR